MPKQSTTQASQPVTPPPNYSVNPGITNWEWNEQRYQAAQMIADGKRTNTYIAKKLGVELSTLYLWKATAEFEEHVQLLLEELKESVRARGIAILERRVDSILDDYESTQVIIRERGAGENAGVNTGAMGGLRTGFIVKDYKGKDADQPVYSVDTGLITARAKLRREIAEELGQIVDKKELSGPGGKPMQIIIAPEDTGL